MDDYNWQHVLDILKLGRLHRVQYLFSTNAYQIEYITIDGGERRTIVLNQAQLRNIGKVKKKIGRPRKNEF